MPNAVFCTGKGIVADRLAIEEMSASAAAFAKPTGSNWGAGGKALRTIAGDRSCGTDFTLILRLGQPDAL
jgi:hypothetical protein